MGNSHNPLHVILERVGYAEPAKGAFFPWDEVNGWPSGALDVLVASGLLQPAQPMAAIECDGCEENCTMFVTVYPAHEDNAGRAFITCDKRDDMGRVRVEFRRMKQWQATGGLIAAVLARLLGLPKAAFLAADGSQWDIGVLKGRVRRSPVRLLAGDGLRLTLAGHTVPLIELLTIKKDTLALDKSALIRLVNNPVGNAEEENPEARRERIRARVGEEKAKKTKAFLQVVAKEEGVSLTRIKQLIKGNAALEDDGLKKFLWAGSATSTKQTSSKKPSTKY